MLVKEIIAVYTNCENHTEPINTKCRVTGKVREEIDAGATKQGMGRQRQMEISL
jgi:hypothetical protein